MSEDFDNITTEHSTAPPLSHRRILWAMALVAILGGLAGLIFISPQFGFGVMFGGVLSLVNYYWLKVSLRKIFDSTVAHGEKPRFLAIRYFSRYLTLGVILAMVFLTDVFPIIAVILGLASFALAIMVEGLILLFSTFFKSREL